MEDLQNGNSQPQSNPSDPHLQSFDGGASSHDDFLEQMLYTLPNCSWPDSSSNPNPNPLHHHSLKPPDDSDDLSSKLRLHVNSPSMDAAAKSFLLLQQQQQQQQQQFLLSRGVGSPSGAAADSGLMPLPLSLASADYADIQQGADGYGFPGALHGNGQTPNQQPFQARAMPSQNLGSQPPASASTGGSGQAPQRQRVRARRGQATDPHSIAERLRRERIAERMKALQELVPNANKTDKASMLDEIIDYVRFLQLQVKVLSMSRLGGAAAVAPPLVADRSSEGGPSSNNGAGSSNDGMTVTENQVVKLMEEDMGSAMQYLQGKGLCLMPISLATAISTATCHTRNAGNLSNSNHRPPPPNNSIPPLIANANGNGGDGPSSPNLSGLTVQSANLVNGHGSVKDSNPAPKA